MAVARSAWGKYAFEFVLIFVAVVAAFALNQWSSDKRDAHAEEKILREIHSGLGKDLYDVRLNVSGHEKGLAACAFWRKVLRGEQVDIDSLDQRVKYLTRDFVCLQNSSGYQSLRSRGLELVTDDSLRSDIISLYEYDLVVLAKLEETYAEMQFFAHFQSLFSEVVGPYLRFADTGVPQGLDLPLTVTEDERRRFLLAIWRIESNRRFAQRHYERVQERIGQVRDHIDRVLAERGR
ncbi:MAG: hypothetical protein H6591_03210 [Flavobacteriales bacterium]|nr:hypothetical protein [Flavobacteriales bacterium]